jgi:UPF0716 protein FxsA
MFLLVLLGVPALEVFVFIEVGRAIGWLAALAILVGTSLLGTRLLRVQGRWASVRVSRAVAERRAPARAALDGALAFLGAALLAAPGFVTDAIGVLLTLPPTRVLARRWLARRYAGRTMGFLASAGRFAGDYPRSRPADVESTAIEDDADRLGR